MWLADMPLLWIVALAVAVLNLPFGFWRAGVGKFTLRWFLAVHAPVPIVVGLRVMAHLEWRFATFAVLISAFCVGQFLGGKLRHLRQRRTNARRADL